jgi:hypothetical protein
MPKKLIETRWSVFSDAFVRFQRLPFGSGMRLIDKSGRKKRADFRVKRVRVNSQNASVAADFENVKSLLDSARGLLSTDLHARRLTIELVGPDGQQINGNTRLLTVRQMEPKPSADDIERAEANEQLIEEVQSNATAAIRESEYLVDDPSSTVCAAYVRALVERYGRAAVREALAS